MRILKRIVLTVIAVLLLAVGAIVSAGLNDHMADADLVVVPGNTIAPDGAPSPRLKARLDAAIQIFREGRAPLIFVSGGIGKEGFDEAMSMSIYLVKSGVPANSIVIDSLGVDTATTAKNVASYMRENSLRTAIVATQYFHVPRTKLALERQGVRVVGTAHARYFEMRDLYSILRETIAYVAYYAKS